MLYIGERALFPIRFRILLRLYAINMSSTSADALAFVLLVMTWSNPSRGVRTFSLYRRDAPPLPVGVCIISGSLPPFARFPLYVSLNSLCCTIFPFCFAVVQRSLTGQALILYCLKRQFLVIYVLPLLLSVFPWGQGRYRCLTF